MLIHAVLKWNKPERYFNQHIFAEKPDAYLGKMDEIENKKVIDI